MNETLNFLKKIYETTKSRIKWDGEFSECYPVKKCVRYDDPLSGLLFNIYLDVLTEFIAERRCIPIMLENIVLFLLKYADDIVLVSPDLNHLQESLNRFSEYANLFHIENQYRKIVLYG